MGDVSAAYPPPPSSKGRKAKSLAYLASEFVKLVRVLYIVLVSC